MFYLVKTPWWLKKLYRSCVWDMPGHDKVVYLSFDDGPHPVATPFVLNTLAQYNATATFFCIGKNVTEQPVLYRQIIQQGHGVGNHTHNHLNGWKTSTQEYIDNIALAAQQVASPLFRPPYGRLRWAQIRALKDYKIIMWSVLSGDFDPSISSKQCLDNVLQNVSPGAIIVFHDSEKAFEKMSYALPILLQQLSKQGYQFKRLDIDMQ